MPARRLTRWLPGVVVAVACVVVLKLTGTPLRATALYAVGSVWSVLLPGMLVSRALRSRPRTLVADLSLGFVTGLALQLAAWFVFTGLGAGGFLVLWPIPVVVLCVAVGPLRRRVWSLAPYERRLHPATAWASVAAFAAAMVPLVNTFGATGLPPSRWYPDMYWHLGNTHELMRTVAPLAPQVAGESLTYHWFANAHFAAMSLTTGIDPILVVGRLWMPVIAVVTLGMLLAAADTLVGRSWPGVVAAALTFPAPRSRWRSGSACPGWSRWHSSAPPTSTRRR
ncbi:hypothetical protein [Propionicicella superfundia]|uniref:hypothetical protein n=1 Tax=Propionicicella superfundia TaxID=348582 RepID=UPI0003F8AAEC|nr:hypothetical protein [Propionicicella superfundia]